MDAALIILGISLTSLHFIVGRLSFGIGFAAKDLLDNLVGGAILHTSRPFKVEDVAEVGDDIGWVKDIEFRTTCIHTEENIDILVPNTVLLNEKIINWTRDDNMVLSKISIGLACETDIHEATRLMIDAARNVDRLQPEPAPFVLFKEHGASTLKFDLYFSARVHNKMGLWVCESEVTYSLNDALRAAGIEIAYPQLDVHMSHEKDGHARSARKTTDGGLAGEPV